MAEQVLPITQLQTIGLVKDTPAIALPPNAFSDVLNMRFNNGGVHKIEGEESLFLNYSGDGLQGDIIHIAWWANPNLTPTDGYYIVVTTLSGTDYVYVIKATTGETSRLDIQLPSGGQWQHTEYQGGYAIVLNNGIARPFYVLDGTGNTDIDSLQAYELPGWDSYYTNGVAVNETYDASSVTPEFNIGSKVNFDIEKVIVSVISGVDKTVKFTHTLTSESTVDQCTLSFDTRTNTHVVTIATAPGGDPAFTEFLESGDTVYITGTSVSVVQVRCGVIKSWGDVLVAGNLREINAPFVFSVDSTANTIEFNQKHALSTSDVIYIKEPEAAKGLYNVQEVVSPTVVRLSDLPSADYTNTKYTIVSSGTAVRNQSGVVRISDVAPPGGIPNNWNPYAVGVSTAEEFTLATTGIIQDMSQMQGNMFVYTNNSIHMLSKTGNTSTPYIASIITDTHGALCVDAVQEFQGKHIVVGSNDIYEFSGHPASISSIADSRVRDYFYETISGDYQNKLFLMLNPAQDELWVNYPTYESTGNINETLIWNYGLNVWSKRVVTETTCGTIANTKVVVDGELGNVVDSSVLRPVFAKENIIYGLDVQGVYTDALGNNYESYIEHVETPLTPEFDVESLSSVALLTNKTTSNNIPLTIRVRNTDHPGQSIDMTTLESNSKDVPFTIGSDYKSDVRLTGRFMSYRITDNSESSYGWKLLGMQIVMSKGGTR